MGLNDQQFIAEFEACTLDPKCFSHVGHLRLGWLYLDAYPLEVAVQKVTTGIAKYASALGVTDKFQYTLTQAALMIIYARKQQGSSQDFNGFLEQNPDLVNDMMGVLLRHYSADVLSSALAKSQFVAPDLKLFG